MVQICRASRKTSSDPIQQGIDRFYVYQDIARYATKGITVDEFPAADGSVELVAEVVTMTKQDYDELMLFLKGIWSTGSIDHAMLASKIIEKITGRYPRAGA